MEIVNSNPQNVETSPVPRDSSKFPLSREILGTMRFAELTPILAEECVENDKDINLTPSHDLRSYTLKSPLMQDINLHKTYGFVPMPCLLPINWEKLVVNPNFGDDVIADEVGTTVDNFRWRISRMLKACYDSILSPSGSSNSIFYYAVNNLVLIESFLSTGSIFSALNCHLSSLINVSKIGGDTNEIIDFDTLFDGVISNIIDSLLSEGIRVFDILVNSDTLYHVYLDSATADKSKFGYITFREFLDIVRDNLYNWSIQTSISYVDLENILSDFSVSFPFDVSSATDVDNLPVDLAPFWSYQIFCAHYFTNDHIDTIINADLFRQYILSLVSDSDFGILTFTYNGVITQYDALSAKYFKEFVSLALTNFTNLSPTYTPSFKEIGAYFGALCRFNKSLRYEDYFVGSRKFPLGVGDTDVNVVNGHIDIVDVSRKSMIAKFLHATNRFGKRAKEYIKGLFGANIPYDYHEPMWLANVNGSVFSPEVENTGSDQLSKKNSITSIFRSADKGHAFVFNSDMPGWLIGVQYYDVNRAYSDGIDPMFNHTDRFDHFNPFMQYIGDQPIRSSELSSRANGDDNYSYTNRYMEYKQHYGYAFGGFINDYIDGFGFLYSPNMIAPNITSSFIRNHNFELDKYYTSLTGFSLGHYFHFIVKTKNELSAVRPMVYAPSLKI